MAFAGSPTTLTVTSLNSLASDAYWKSAGMTFSSNLSSLIFQVKLSTANTGAGGGSGYFGVYLACSNDNTTFDGTITAGEGTWSTTAPPTAISVLGLQMLGRLALNTTATTTVVLTRSFFVTPFFVPKYGVLVIQNAGGKPLLGSGNSVSYLENTQS